MLARRCLAIFVLAFFAPLATDAAEPLTFERDVRPILKTYCFQCHGEDEELAGNLDVRLVRLLAKGGETGPALIAGDAGKSLFLERIVKGEMPPEGKKVTAAELAKLQAWVAAGAKTAKPEPEKLANITDEERAFWSFQPIANPAQPAIADGSAALSPIDHFLLRSLAEQQLGYSVAAERATLIRRLSFDLLGLPPKADDVQAFVDDVAPDAYEQLVDRLLASPHYGERWGRHWLDVAGYADSDGFSEKDSERPNAFKYRDYVIRAFNTDKPWDQFIVEQLAGDELLKPPYANLSPDEAEKLIATGFLRMAPDGTSDPAADQNVARNEVVADTIKIVSSSLLGITVGCAQCHNHRYDPVPQTDYYSLRAVFEPAYDVKNWRVPGARNVSLWSAETRAKAKEIQAAIAANAAEQKAELEKLTVEVQERQFEKLPEEEREQARAAVKAPVKERTAEQKEYLAKHPNLIVLVGRVNQFDKEGFEALTKKYADRAAELAKQKPEENEAAVLTEIPGKVPETHLFHRGDINSPRDAVLPGELSVLQRDELAEAMKISVDDPAIPTTGRRLAYAKWLTSGKHPLVARVLVNRFWLHHFGRGIVPTPADFGALGEKPSHPELLDWLATRFMQDGWELKKFHRQLLTSAAYQQSSQRRDELDAVDPDNRLLGRMNLRRLEAETVRDAMLDASGRLTHKLHGKSVPVTPDELGQVVVGVDTRDGAGRPTGKVVPLGEEEFRRSVYVQVRRSLPLSMLETFDAPLLTPNCELRTQSTVAPQSLLLMNNGFVLAQSNHLATQIITDHTHSPREQIEAAWRRVFGQSPTPTELAAAEEFLAAQTREFELTKLTAKDPPSPQTRALASLCQALFGSNQFLYVD